MREWNWTIPNHWKRETLVDVASWASGGTPKAIESKYYGGGIPWLVIGDLNDGLVSSSAKTITDIGLRESSAKYVEPGSIMVAMYGSIGKLGIAGFRCTTNQAIAFTRSISEDVEPKYLFHYLASVRDLLLAEGKGGAQANISQTVLKGISFCYPDRTEQRRIVAKLDQVTAHIDEAKARLDTIPTTLKRFRQSILAAACSGRLTADWRKNNSPESADVLLARLVKRRKQAYTDHVKSAKESGNRKPRQRTGLDIVAINTDDLPGIPDSWTYCHLQNLGEFTRGRSKHRPRDDAKLYGGLYPFIQTGDVANSGGKITSHRQTYSEAGLAQSRLFPAGTLCITIAANIADSAILTYPACFPDSVVGLIPDEEFLIEWARYYIQVIQNDLETYAPATAQKNINMEILELVSVPLPPYQEQMEIVRRVEALFKQADAIEARYKKARAFVEKLTPSVLAKAFRGELV